MQPILIAILKVAGIGGRGTSFPTTHTRGRHLRGPVASRYASIPYGAPPSLPTTFGQLAGTPKGEISVRNVKVTQKNLPPLPQAALALALMNFTPPRQTIGPAWEITSVLV